jgi:hypothetical protein
MVRGAGFKTTVVVLGVGVGNKLSLSSLAFCRSVEGRDIDHLLGVDLTAGRAIVMLLNGNLGYKSSQDRLKNEGVTDTPNTNSRIWLVMS